MDPTSVVVPDEPRKGRSRTIVGIALVAVLAIGGGIAFALTRESDDAASETNSLTEALAATRNLKSYEFTIEDGFRGNPVAAEGVLDQANNLLHLTMPFAAGFEMIVEIDSKVRYVSRASYGSDPPFDTEWLRIENDTDDSQSMLPMSLVTAPLGAIALIEKAILVEDLGDVLPDRVTPLEVGGVRVREYRVTIKGADVAAAMPQLESQLDEKAGSIPDEVLYHFFVDENDVVRRIYFEIKARLGTRVVDVTVLSINEPVQFELPAPEDVTDSNDLP